MKKPPVLYNANMGKKELSIIIVNYNTKDLLRNCLSSVINNTNGVDYEIIFVDNASSDGSVEKIKAEFPSVKIISNKENVGFSCANNQGIKAAQGKNILLLNSDTLINDNCLYKTLQFVQTTSDAGVIGCKVLNHDMTLQYTCYHAPNFFTELIFFTKEIVKGGLDPVTHWKYMRYWNHQQIKEVDCIAGCFLWVKREVFNEAGLLDKNIFMYYEDSDFCRRVKKNSDYKIYYYPEAEIVHLKGKSRDITNNNSLKFCFQSFVYYLDKWYGKFSGNFFILLCAIIWRVEIFIFSFFGSNEKFMKKIVMLKELLSIKHNRQYNSSKIRS